VHQRGQQVEPPLHAAGVGADRAVERVGQVDEPAQLGDAGRQRRLGQPVEQAL
jgi:hypothetical protein